VSTGHAAACVSGTQRAYPTTFGGTYDSLSSPISLGPVGGDDDSRGLRTGGTGRSAWIEYPYVLDKASGMLDAGAILANFGISEPALMDVLSGKVKPQRRLPFALANNLEAIAKERPDKAGYPKADTLYGFGFGLSY